MLSKMLEKLMQKQLNNCVHKFLCTLFCGYIKKVPNVICVDDFNQKMEDLS